MFFSGPKTRRNASSMGRDGYRLSNTSRATRRTRAGARGKCISIWSSGRTNGMAGIRRGVNAWRAKDSKQAMHSSTVQPLRHSAPALIAPIELPLA